MHQTQWSAERPLPPPVSLTSQSHHEKPPEVTCTSRGTPGCPASTRERPRETFFNTSRGQIPMDQRRPSMAALLLACAIFHDCCCLEEFRQPTVFGCWPDQRRPSMAALLVSCAIILDRGSRHARGQLATPLCPVESRSGLPWPHSI